MSILRSSCWLVGVSGEGEGCPEVGVGEVSGDGLERG